MVLTKRFDQKNTESNDNLSSPDLVSSQRTHIFKRTNDKRKIDIINNFTDSCGVKNTNTKRSVGYILRQKTRKRIMIAFTLLLILIGFRYGYIECKSAATVVEWISGFCFSFILWNCFRYVFLDRSIF